MSWFNIVKQPKLRTSSNITTELGSESKPEEDEPCKRKLLDYRIKINNIRSPKVIYALDYVHKAFKDMPEEVACKVLKLLNGLKLNIRMNQIKSSDYITERVVVGDKEYSIAGDYSFASDELEGFLELHIVWSNLARNTGDEVLWFLVSAKGQKEEVMKEVDWR